MFVYSRAPRALVLFSLLALPLGSGASGPAPEDPPISLGQILDHAQEHAPLLLVARARETLGVAELEASAILIARDPEFELAAGPRFGAAGVGGLELQASLTQPLEIFGQRGLRRRAAANERTLSGRELEVARWEIHQAVHLAYHEALLGHARQVAARRILDFADRVVEITERRLEAGEVSQVELRLARGEHARSHQALIAAAGDSMRARLRLAGIAGWPRERPPRVEGGLDVPRAAPPLEALLTRAREESPIVAARAAGAEAARAHLALADREAFPSPALGVAYGQERAPGEPTGVHTTQLTLSLDLPLFARNRRSRYQARARLGVAEAEFEAAHLLTETRIADAHAAVEIGARRIIAFGEDVLPEFAGNLDLLERAFELGEIDLLEVMIARGRFIELEAEALDAYEDYFASVARLEAYLGAEVWSEEQHPSHPAQEVTP